MNKKKRKQLRNASERKLLKAVANILKSSWRWTSFIYMTKMMKKWNNYP